MVDRAADKDETAIERKLGFDFGNINFWLPALIELLILVIVFFSLRETINFLYADDDLMTSLLRGQFLNGINLRNFLKFEYVHTLEQIGIGRFMVGGFPLHLPMLFFNIVQYRVYILIFICSNVWMFGKCVYQWTNSYKIKWFAMLLSPLFFQIHFNFHHPILSYYGGMQLLFLVIFSSMFFFWKYIENSQKRWLVVSGALYIWGLTIYEVAFVILPVFILLAYLATRNIKKTIWYSLTHISLFSLFLIANFVNRVANAKTVGNYSGSAFNLDPFKILTATLKQMSATVPLSNFIAINWGRIISSVPNLFSISKVTPGDLLTVILFLVILFLINRTIETQEKIDKKHLLILGSIGFLIVLLPAGVIGLSATYQASVSWGIGHIPVYFQYFGLIILATCIYVYVREFLKKYNVFKIFDRTGNTVLIALSVFILLANQQYGRVELNNYDKAMYDKMLALQYSLQDNLLFDIPSEATVINTQVVNTGLTKSDYSLKFYNAYSQNHLKNVVYVDNFTEKVVSDLKMGGKSSGNENFTPTQPTYIVRSNRDKDEGVVYVGRVKNMIVDLDEQTIIRYEIDELRIYVMNSVTSRYVSLYEKNQYQIYENKYFELDPKFLANGANGRIYIMDFHNTVDFNSAFLVYDVDTIESSLYNIESYSVELSSPIIVTNKLNISGIFKSGWSGIESWGIWSEGNRSELFFDLSEDSASDLSIKFNTFIFAPKENLRFSASVNGSFAGDFSLAQGNQSFSIFVPKSYKLNNNSSLKIVFEIENPSSPLQAGLSADSRLLGIGVVSFVVEVNKK